MVLSSSLMPPDRKWMPGTAAGMVRSIVRVVYLATSCGLAVGASKPGRHILRSVQTRIVLKGTPTCSLRDFKGPLGL